MEKDSLDKLVHDSQGWHFIELKEPPYRGYLYENPFQFYKAGPLLIFSKLNSVSPTLTKCSEIPVKPEQKVLTPK